MPMSLPIHPRQHECAFANLLWEPSGGPERLGEAQLPDERSADSGYVKRRAVSEVEQHLISISIEQSHDSGIWSISQHIIITAIEISLFTHLT